MAWNFTFEVEGIPLFNRSFNRVQEHISDLRPVWDEVQTAFYRIENEQFKSEGARGGGGKWKRLSTTYAKRKAKLYPGMPILQATGRMYEALTSETADSAVVKTKDEFGIGTTLEYPHYHQKGTSKMPKRAPVDFGDQQKRDLQKSIQRGLLEIIKRDPTVRSTLNFD